MCVWGVYVGRVCAARASPLCSVAKNWIRTVASNYTAFEFFFNRWAHVLPLCAFPPVSSPDRPFLSSCSRVCGSRACESVLRVCCMIVWLCDYDLWLCVPPPHSSTIQIDFQSVLNDQLDALHANVDSLQLLDAELPVEFNAARTAQASAYQDISVASSQSQVAQDQARANVNVQLQNYEVGVCVCTYDVHVCVCVCARVSVWTDACVIACACVTTAADAGGASAGGADHRAGPGHHPRPARQIRCGAGGPLPLLLPLTMCVTECVPSSLPPQALANLATSLGLSQKELLSYVWVNAMQQAQVCVGAAPVNCPVILMCVCVAACVCVGDGVHAQRQRPRGVPERGLLNVCAWVCGGACSRV